MPGHFCALARVCACARVAQVTSPLRATMTPGANGQQMASKWARCTAFLHSVAGYCPPERLIMAYSEGSRRYIVAISSPYRQRQQAQTIGRRAGLLT